MSDFLLRRPLFWAQNQWYSSYPYVLKLALVFALYLGAGKLGLAVPFTSSNVSPVWPAAGVAVAAVLIFGINIAPAIAFAAFFVNFLSPIAAPVAVGIGLGNASSAVLASYLLRRFSDFQISLPRLRDVLRFVTLAAAFATTVAASIGVTFLTIAHTKAWSSYGSAWRVWWLGDAMGVLVVAPLLLTCRELLGLWRGWRILEFGLLSVAILATSATIFGPWAAVRDDVLAFVVFPFVIWAAIRFRVPGAAFSSLLVASVAVWGTTQGFGPFVNHTPLRNAMLLQVFIAVTSLTGLMLAAVINEREHIGEALKIAERLQAAKEIEIARQVQQKLFPQRLVELKTLEYAGACNQARSVGGDYYDFVELGPGRVGLVLADVAGKGMSAALLMANLQASIRSLYSISSENLPQLLHLVNLLFYENTEPGRYATLFIGTYDDASRRLLYVNCGHNPPLVIHQDGSVERLAATATVLGLYVKWQCSTSEVQLTPGDLLVLYSDGVTEAWNDHEEDFGEARLRQVLQANKNLGAQDLLKKLLEDVNQFSAGKQSDDVTAIVARVH